MVDRAGALERLVRSTLPVHRHLGEAARSLADRRRARLSCARSLWGVMTWASFPIGRSVSGVIIIAITVAKTLSGMLRMMSIRAAARNLTPSDEAISELRQSLDAVQNRLSEVEERLDFTERLLAKQRDSERLGSPPR